MIYTKFMTEELVKICKANRRKAKIKMNVPKGMVLHHKDPNLRYNDIERYIQWLPEDLLIMTNGEHTALHNKLHDYSKNDYSYYLTPTFKQHMSDAIKEWWKKRKAEQNIDENL